MSAMYGNNVVAYRNWDEYDSCDSFIFIGPDDYYFYKKLGYNNSIFIPNLYTYDPSEVKSSNLNNHNIVILGRLNDWIKGVKFAIKAMEYIVKEVPDAVLYLVSSDSRVQYLKNLTRDLNLTKNIIFKGGTFNLTQLFHNSSVHMYTSLSEAFPMALIEGKAHGMPIVGFDVPYSLPYQKGFIGVELFDIKGLARETIKLLKDYEYRKRKGEEAKKSLDVVKNNETVELWGRLCESLLSRDREDYRKLQSEIENKYYNETRARQHLESQYNILLRYNFNLSCHSFNSFTNMTYLKNISKCNMTEVHENVKHINIFNKDE
jgi:glycosyltransferase involved in cell wall biosynthesis